MKVETWNLELGIRSAVRCRRSAVCGLWLSCLLLSGCAKIGDPLPPLVHPTDTVTDVETVQVEDHFQIVFSLPSHEIRWVEIYRQCGSNPSPPEQSLVRLEPEELSHYNQGNKFFFEDHPGLSQPCSYWLRFVNRQGLRSPFSNLAQTLPIPPARPPTNLRYQVHQTQIVVKWDAPVANIDGSQPPRLAGYLVNSKHLVRQPEYTETEFQFGQEHSYQVQSVSREADPLILSGYSDTLKFVPRDEFPPGIPQNITILSLEGKVQIFWDANKESDLKGYFVYSGTDPNRLRKSSSSITINRYVDESVTTGKAYYYQLSAMDRAGNESPKSDIVTITVN
ncbi:hypothetical protein MYX82_05635 [Acidobacteria bacterium AH-259-D05]|nr:hypothetical protein [Acidobacteria bacterium AH-259-D05]